MKKWDLVICLYVWQRLSTPCPMTRQSWEDRLVFTINVRDAYVCAGAGFVVVLTGSIMTMPGLPKKPAAEGIDVVNGKITGLF